MATRCIIKIENFPVCQLYKHWDGYPEATLKWLENFNKRFTAKRGNDLPYKMAQLIRSSAFLGSYYNLDNSKFTGWGVTRYGDEMGEEYIYTLMADGTVKYQFNGY